MYGIVETTKIKKKYKCPYCEVRDTKENLIIHVNEKHDELIPEGYTASRVVFNHIYHKEYGVCTECGKQTPWNEDNCRYDRQCSDECRRHYADSMHKNVENIHGDWNLCKNPAHLEKMLEGRKISGTYKFKNSKGTHSYVGSFERRLLEFEDTVIHISASELVIPGPIIEYQFENEKGELQDAIWITDQYYIPYNLIIEVKDGGNNPNNREMELYRRKQIAKEEAIMKLGKYNYIRLTDNQFNQLLYAFSILKLTDPAELQFFINEITDNIKMPKESTYLIQNFTEGSIFSDWYVSRSPLLTELVGIGTDKKLHVYDKNRLNKYNIFRIKDDNSANKVWKAICESKKQGEEFENSLFEAVTGLYLVSEEQPFLMNNLEYMEDCNEFLYAIRELVMESILPTKSLLPFVPYPNLNMLDTNRMNAFYCESLLSGQKMICNKNNKIAIPLRDKAINLIMALMEEGEIKWKKEK